MINVYNLWKSYKKAAVLKGLTLSIPGGKKTIILGRSGVGKSVLLRHIIGLEKPDQGFVEVSGVRISDLPQQELYKAMKDFGMLFQNSALFDSMTVGENVAFYFTEHKTIADSALKDRTEDALSKVGLSGFQKKMPSELSGGQRKRAALARLIIYRPKIMLVDEPTTGLDPITAMQISELIAKTHEELNATTVIITHDLPAALYLGDLFAMHHDGKIASLDNKENFLHSKDPLTVEFLQDFEHIKM